METNETKHESIFKRKPWVKSLSFFVLIFAALGAFIFWQVDRGIVAIDDSTLVAPVVNLSTTAPGTLNALYVKSGDVIQPDMQVALVGTTIISSKEGGVVVSTPDALGGYYAPGMTIVSVVKTSGMKVVGQLDENKGLNKIAVGQRATFTVDAFPGRNYEGIVDEVSATSAETGIAFSISDKRPIQKFDVTVRFDVSKYPELKNGMSAKIRVHTIQ